MKRFSVLLAVAGSLFLAGSAQSAEDSELVVELRDDQSPVTYRDLEECRAYVRGKAEMSPVLKGMLVQTARGRATLGCGVPDAQDSKEPPGER